MKELIKIIIKPVYSIWLKLKKKIDNIWIRVKPYLQKAWWAVKDLGHVYNTKFMYDIITDIENAKNIDDIAHVYYCLRFSEQKIASSDEMYISYDEGKKIFHGNLNYLAESIINNNDTIYVAKRKCIDYKEIVTEGDIKKSNI